MQLSLIDILREWLKTTPFETRIEVCNPSYAYLWIYINEELCGTVAEVYGDSVEWINGEQRQILYASDPEFFKKLYMLLNSVEYYGMFS